MFYILCEIILFVFGSVNNTFKTSLRARCQQLTPVIPATCEAKIKRITVPDQSRQKKIAKPTYWCICHLSDVGSLK
jgi:hypothetical protein